MGKSLTKRFPILKKYLAAEASPVHINIIQNQGVIVELQDDQQENQEKHHKYTHYWSCAPTWSDLSVLRI